MQHCDHASAYSPSTHCPAAQRLAEQLASWAANASEEGSPWLQQLLALPLDSLQEDALLGWLKQRQAAGDHLALALPLYFAQRGRLAEALWYYARWGRGAALHAWRVEPACLRHCCRRALCIFCCMSCVGGMLLCGMCCVACISAAGSVVALPYGPDSTCRPDSTAAPVPSAALSSMPQVLCDAHMR